MQFTVVNRRNKHLFGKYYYIPREEKVNYIIDTLKSHPCNRSGSSNNYYGWKFDGDYVAVRFPCTWSEYWKQANDDFDRKDLAKRCKRPYTYVSYFPKEGFRLTICSPQLKNCYDIIIAELSLRKLLNIAIEREMINSRDEHLLVNDLFNLTSSI